MKLINVTEFVKKINAVKSDPISKGHVRVLAYSMKRYTLANDKRERAITYAITVLSTKVLNMPESMAKERKYIWEQIKVLNECLGFTVGEEVPEPTPEDGNPYDIIN